MISETQRGSATCWRAHSWQEVEPRFGSGSGACVLHVDLRLDAAIFSLSIIYFCMLAYYCDISSNYEILLPEWWPYRPMIPSDLELTVRKVLTLIKKLGISWGPAFQAATKAAEQEAGYGLVLPGRACTSSETEWGGRFRFGMSIVYCQGFDPAIAGFDLVWVCLIGHQLQSS